MTAKADFTEYCVTMAKYKITLNDTGEEYEPVRKEMAVPLQYDSDFKHHSVLPVIVNKNNPRSVLFKFDKVGPALNIIFDDPQNVLPLIEEELVSLKKSLNENGRCTIINRF